MCLQLSKLKLTICIGAYALKETSMIKYKNKVLKKTYAISGIFCLLCEKIIKVICRIIWHRAISKKTVGTVVKKPNIQYKIVFIHKFKTNFSPTHLRIHINKYFLI